MNVLDLTPVYETFSPDDPGDFTLIPEYDASKDPVNITNSELGEHLLSIMVLGAGILFHFRTTLAAVSKIVKTKKKVWVGMTVVSFIILFHLAVIIFSLDFRLKHSYIYIDPWVIRIPYMLEAVITFTLLVMRTLRLRMAFPYTPKMFWVVVGGVGVPLGLWTAGSSVTMMLYIWEIVPIETLSEYRYLQSFGCAAVLMGVSMVTDVIFMIAVGRATSKTSSRRSKPRLERRTMAYLVLHILFAGMYITTVFIDSIWMTHVASLALIVDQWTFIRINDQVAVWFYGAKQQISSAVSTPSGWCQEDASKSGLGHGAKNGSSMRTGTRVSPGLRPGPTATQGSVFSAKTGATGQTGVSGKTNASPPRPQRETCYWDIDTFDQQMTFQGGLPMYRV